VSRVDSLVTDKFFADKLHAETLKTAAVLSVELCSHVNLSCHLIIIILARETERTNISVIMLPCDDFRLPFGFLPKLVLF